MKILLNGKEQEVEQNISLKALIEGLNLKSETVIAELNESIIKKEKWPELVLKESDKIELVRFVGGG